MRTPTQDAATVPIPVSSRERPGQRDLSWLASTLIVAILSTVLLSFYLSIYPLKGYKVPIGWDASEYLWRTKLAQEVGLENLGDRLPSSLKPKSGRPAFPVVAATLSSLGGASLFRLAAVLPSVMAVAIGLAAGAFVAAVLRRPVWEVVVVSLIVALSPFVIRLMIPEGYVDNMFAAAVFLVASIPIAFSIEERSALVPAILLLGVGATIHWAFFGFMAATLLLCAAAFLPESWKRWRSGEARLLDAPTTRLAESVVGAGALGAGVIFVLLSNGLPSPRLDVSEFAKKLRQDMRRYVFMVTLPAATLGAVSLARDSRRRGREGLRARFALTFLLSWCAVVLGGYVARNVLHLPVPAHRFLAFALAVPVLGVLGLVWVARLVSRFSRPLAALTVVAGIAAAGWVARTQWFVAHPHMKPDKIRDAAAAESYLRSAGVRANRPVVFIIGAGDFTSAGLMVHMARAALPAERLQDAYFYVGSPHRYLARQPMGTPVSKRYFKRMRSVYRADPVALILSSYNRRHFRRWVDERPGTHIGSRLAVVQGPAPPAHVRAPRPAIGELSPLNLALLSMGSLVVLAFVGLGWSLAMLRQWLRRIEAVAIAPAVGVAALALGAILIDRIGFRLIGLAGALTPIAVGLLGWTVFAAVLLSRRRGPSRA